MRKLAPCIRQDAHRNVPQRRCGRSQYGSRALASQRCSSWANERHLPCETPRFNILLLVRQEKHALGYLARLNDPLQLLNHQWANPHFPLTDKSATLQHQFAAFARTLFADETVVAVVRVVRVSQTSMRVLKLEELMTVFTRVPCTVQGGKLRSVR